MKELFAPFVNVLILSGILIYFLREPLRAFVRARHEGLKREIKSAREQLRQAEARAQELGARLSGLEREIESLRVDARRDTEKACQEIVAGSRRLAAQYVADARGFGEGMVREMKEELRRELVEKIFQGAEESIQKTISGEDRLQLAREFSQSLEDKR